MKMKVLKIILLISIVAALAVIISAFICSTSIRTTEYAVPIAGIEKDAKIVCIADLHSHEYGKDNGRLIAKIVEQRPDAILLNGDMINNDATEKEIEQFLKLNNNLIEIAPVFFAPGNHEIEYMNEHDEEFLKRVAETGTVVVYDSFIETELAGNTIRIGGSCGHYRDINWDKKLDYIMQESIGSTDIPAIVMNHMPESLFADDAAARWTGDLYICAHTHGGVIRIPGVGGLYAPTQSWFPKYDRGEFTAWGQHFIITSGLSGYKGVPRLFNMPEICVVNITPK